MDSDPTIDDADNDDAVIDDAVIDDPALDTVVDTPGTYCLVDVESVEP